MEITLESLYIAHRTQLVALAVMHGCDHFAAEDLVQDLFINLHKFGHVAKIDGHQNPIGWLKQKMRWMVLKRHAKIKLPSHGGGACHVEVSEAYGLADGSNTPDTALNLKDTRAVLDSCGCTEETVIWSPQQTRAKAVALYRFRKAVAPKLKKLLSC